MIDRNNPITKLYVEYGNIYPNSFGDTDRYMYKQYVCNKKSYQVLGLELGFTRSNAHRRICVYEKICDMIYDNLENLEVGETPVYVLHINSFQKANLTQIHKKLLAENVNSVEKLQSRLDSLYERNIIGINGYDKLKKELDEYNGKLNKDL